jgi:hypothetical protein
MPASSDQGKWLFSENAAMQPFTNASLTVDTLNGYHNLTNGRSELSLKKVYRRCFHQFVVFDTFNIKMGNFELRDFAPKSTSKASRHCCQP